MTRTSLDQQQVILQPANTFGQVAWGGILSAGSVIRPHNNPTGFGTSDNTIFTITKVSN